MRSTASAARAPAKVPADDILVRLHTTREPRQRLQLLLGAAEHVSAIDARRAFEHALEAAAVATELADDVAHAEALFQQGRCAELLLDHGPALDLYGRALAGFEAARNELATAKTLRAIGFIHDSLGDFSQALDFQLRALEIDERIGNTASRAATLRTIGLVCSKTGDHATGLDFYRQSLALCTHDGDALERGKTLNNIGINLKNLGMFQDAHAALTQAHQLFDSLGMPLLQCAALNNLGLVQEKLGDIAGAERTLNDALSLSGSVEYHPGVAHAHMALGRMLAPLSRHDEAREHLLAGLDVSERNGIKLTGYECHEALADLYERTGDHASALRHFRRFHQLEHEVQLESASNKLRAFAIQYQVAAAKRDAELQRERQAVLTRANAELDALNVSLTEANLQKTMLLDQLERQTFEDALTGLANRRRLDQRLADEFALALRHDRPLAVAIADLDEFKRVNDRFSHAVGDAALRALGKLLASQVRHTDLVARFGGEEFVLVLVQTDKAAACRVCEKLRDVVEQFDWDSVHPGLALTLSIGVCADTTLPGHERMLALADRNLYLAKEGGRNRVVC
ncbi:MAG TPA: diguanylate cyclase [Casimicrobiaceae bacterium]|nr:diguanylate cyclase [Casimicrobiaceae bacterium]